MVGMLNPIGFDHFHLIPDLHRKLYPENGVTGFNLCQNTLVKPCELGGLIKIPLYTFKETVVCCFSYTHNVAIYIFMLVSLSVLKLTNFHGVKHKIHTATNIYIFFGQTALLFFFR